jgi:hypothetical protein
MIYYINDNTDHEHHMINDIYKIFIIEHVIHYSLIDFNTHQIEVGEKKEESLEYYFVIDLLFHDAFAHWVYESAIYLPIFSKLKEMYPTLKIVLKERKQFKLLFLKFFDIMETDVVYEMKSDNVCFFPSPISALNDNHNMTDIYQQIIVRFITCFSQYRIDSRLYDYIILPRQIKENYKNNDRTYDMNAIYNAINNTTKKYNILHTDTIIDLKDQIDAVQSATNVILTDGSPFLVNNLFCNHQKLIVFDTVTQYQSSFLFKQNYIIETICRLNNNTYIYLPTYISHTQLIELLSIT